jgi:nitrile hydratase
MVRTRVMNPSTHTRLHRYARGKVGVIEAVRGCFVFPDSNAHGAGEDPHWCYTLRFTGREFGGPGRRSARQRVDRRLGALF